MILWISSWSLMPGFGDLSEEESYILCARGIWTVMARRQTVSDYVFWKTAITIFPVPEPGSSRTLLFPHWEVEFMFSLLEPGQAFVIASINKNVTQLILFLRPCQKRWYSFFLAHSRDSRLWAPVLQATSTADLKLPGWRDHTGRPERDRCPRSSRCSSSLLFKSSRSKHQIF